MLKIAPVDVPDTGISIADLAEQLGVSKSSLRQSRIPGFPKKGPIFPEHVESKEFRDFTRHHIHRKHAKQMLAEDPPDPRKLGCDGYYTIAEVGCLINSDPSAVWRLVKIGTQASTAPFSSLGIVMATPIAP